MYRIYFKLAFQNLLKNYQNTTINLLGLTLGLSSALFIFLFYLSESSYDSFYEKDIYRTNYEFSTPSGNLNMARAFFIHGQAMKEKIDNVNDYAIIEIPYRNDILINKQKVGIFNISAVENNFLHFFDVELIIGDKETVLNNQDDVLISESFANTFFKDESPLNKEIEIPGSTRKIKGVFKDLPSNSSLQYDILCSLERYKVNNENVNHWVGSNHFYLYLTFKNKAEVPNSLEKINALLKKEYTPHGLEMTATLQPIEDIHFHSHHLLYDMPKLRSYESFLVIISIGVIILILSLVNFVVLYTAQKDEEIQTLSLMKIYGAHHKEILISTCIEIGLLILISIGFSLLPFHFILSFINDKLNSVVYLKDYPLEVLFFYLSIGSILIVVLSYLSLRGVKSFSLAESLSGQTQLFSSYRYGDKILLVLQFSTVFILLSVGFIVHQQYQHLLKADHGFSYENIFAIPIYASTEKRDAYKEEIKKMVGVKDVTSSIEFIGIGNNISIESVQLEGSEEFYVTSTLHVDINYLSFFDIKLSKGKYFDSNQKLSYSECIINKEFIQKNNSTQLGSLIKYNGKKYKVVGILDNLAIRGLKQLDEPLMIVTTTKVSGFSYINVKYATSNPLELAQKVRNIWLEDNPDYFLTDAIFYDQSIFQIYKETEGQNQVSLFFGAITLFIAVSGLWGITRYSVLQRTKEISIRRVNGASVQQVLFLFNKDYLLWIFISFFIAMPIAHYYSVEWLSTFPNRIQIQFIDWLLLGIGVCLISVITITAICWKVVNTNPSEILRDM
ncbi:ABC transporter permease [Flammeovirga aprica]|uniref:FtsX-like permease family protein n=1 Tax=Flammeovirga aprica JL-4 TaxID=694437 RepID=A0A7X9S046_9BACT|nr:ABC transporter permease [Flammeovirga aprica]NME71987.1 FtsX-like permease family protein [Flammeovirga aprica JL-4]